MNITDFESKIKVAWSRETTVDSDHWSSENPACGQCAVTALVVNDFFGGVIVWSEAILPTGEKISHYFNLVDGKEVDFTREQFPQGTSIARGIEKKNGFSTTRAYCLSYPQTRQRYKILKNRLVKLLKQEGFRTNLKQSGVKLTHSG